MTVGVFYSITFLKLVAKEMDEKAKTKNR